MQSYFFFLFVIPHPTCSHNPAFFKKHLFCSVINPCHLFCSVSKHRHLFYSITLKIDLLDLFPRTEKCAYFQVHIFALKIYKSHIYSLFSDTTFHPLLSIRNSQRDVLRLFYTSFSVRITLV